MFDIYSLLTDVIVSFTHSSKTVHAVLQRQFSC